MSFAKVCGQNIKICKKNYFSSSLTDLSKTTISMQRILSFCENDYIQVLFSTLHWYFCANMDPSLLMFKKLISCF